MIILITGPSHSGKTKAAYDLTAKYGISTLSLDHLKMGLIRSGHTRLTPMSDTQLLTDLIWPIAKEIIKTAIENEQDLIVEGLYIPFNWKDSFEKEYLEKIEYYCIIFTEEYIKENFETILQFENVAEKRLVSNDYTIETAIDEHNYYRKMVENKGLELIEIDKEYQVEISIFK